MALINKDISIKYRLMGWFTILFFVTTALAAGVVYSMVRETAEENIKGELRASAEAVKGMVQTAAKVSVRNRLRAIAEKNVEILSGLYGEVMAGNMTEVEAKAVAEKILLSQTVGKTGYVYCITSKGILDVHPAEGMTGRNMSDHWLGKAQIRSRNGYIEYEWANPGEDVARPKALSMAYFEPWDWIVSVSSYREEFRSLIKVDDFRANVEMFVVGKTGYVFILDDEGHIVIHPWLQGNVTDNTDEQGRFIFKEMGDRKDGQFEYMWQDPDKDEPQAKLVLFRTIPELGWVVASSSYQDEVYAPLYRLRMVLIVSGMLTLLFILPLAYYLGSSFSRPLSKLANSMARAERGDLSVRADESAQAEVGELAHHFNQYMERLKEFQDGLSTEIDDRIRAEQQLKLFAMVFENALEGISITDRDGTIVAVNPSFTQITGYGPDEVIGKNPRVLKSDRHEGDFYKDMWTELASKGVWHGEIWNRRKNGESYPEILSISAVNDENGDVCNFVAVFHDISDMKLKDEQIEHQAYHDGLTGLPNRTLAQDRLSVAVTHAQREGGKVGVLYLDLDNFKKINDSLGHARGDMLLQQVGARLAHYFREADTVARLGGDEYLLILEHVDDERELVDLAERVLRAFDAPFDVADNELNVTASIGVTLYPDDGEGAGTLIKNADMAMYQSKASGKNSFSLFTQEMRERISRRLRLERDMRKALANKQFTVYFQPKISVASGAVIGMEALVRWHKPDGTVVSPADFIPLAEETGLIVPLGEFVLETSCRAMQVFDGVGCSDISVAVNLSPRQFEQDDMVSMIMSNLERNGLDPTKLELEITESTLMTDIEDSIAKLNALKDNGIAIAIDDFGTGHSSLYYLKNFPIGVLKIDRSFINDITTDASDAQIVETIILMAKNLGIGVVAEGVETREQVDMLDKFGCELIQGFYYSRPLPLEDVIVYLQSEGATCTNIEGL